MGPSQEVVTSSMERPSENEVKVGSVIAVGNSERLADQFLMLGLPLESEVCKKSMIVKITISADRRGDIDATENAKQWQKRKMQFCSLLHFSLPPCNFSAQLVGHKCYAQCQTCKVLSLRLQAKLNCESLAL